MFSIRNVVPFIFIWGRVPYPLFLIISAFFCFPAISFKIFSCSFGTRGVLFKAWRLGAFSCELRFCYPLYAYETYNSFLRRAYPFGALRRPRGGPSFSAPAEKEAKEQAKGDCIPFENPSAVALECLRHIRARGQRNSSPLRGWSFRARLA